MIHLHSKKTRKKKYSKMSKTTKTKIFSKKETIQQIFSNETNKTNDEIKQINKYKIKK